MRKSIIFMIFVIVLLLTIESNYSLVTSATTSECDENSYVEYKQVFYNPSARSSDELFIIDESNLNTELIENVILVLKFYKIEYKLVTNKIMIECSLWKDKSLVMNITQKANDKDWLDANSKK